MYYYVYGSIFKCVHWLLWGPTLYVRRSCMGCSSECCSAMNKIKNTIGQENFPVKKKKKKKKKTISRSRPTAKKLRGEGQWISVCASPSLVPRPSQVFPGSGFWSLAVCKNWASFCILQAIKNQSRGRPGNEATHPRGKCPIDDYIQPVILGCRLSTRNSTGARPHCKLRGSNEAENFLRKLFRSILQV